jgi:hypothetical protein
MSSLFDFGFTVADDDDRIDSSLESVARPQRPQTSLVDRSRLARLRFQRAAAVLSECQQAHASRHAIVDVAFASDGQLICHVNARGALLVHRFVARDFERLGARAAAPSVVLSLHVGTRVRRVLWDASSDSSVWVLCAGQQLPLRLFDLSRTMGEARTMFESQWTVSDIVHLTPSTLAAACNDGVVRIVDRRARLPVIAATAARALLNQGAPLVLASAGDGVLLAVGDSSAQLSLWDVRRVPAALQSVRVRAAPLARFDWIGFDDRRCPERLAFQLSSTAVGVWDSLRQQVAVGAGVGALDNESWLVDATRCAFTRTTGGSGGSVLCHGARSGAGLCFTDVSQLLRGTPAPAPEDAGGARQKLVDGGQYVVDEFGDHHRVADMTVLPQASATASALGVVPLLGGVGAQVGRVEASARVTCVSMHPHDGDFVAFGTESGSLGIASC